MTRFASLFFASLAMAMAFTSSSARADIILEQYEFQGALGSETTLAPSFTTMGISGASFGESNVTPSAGANSINSSGWTNPLANYSFGFAIQAGNTVTVDQLILSTKSSNTGPGFLSLQVSIDGGALKTIASITQPTSNYNDEFLNFAAITASKSLNFFIVAANQTSAAGSGATIGSTGTFRVGDYNPSGAPAPTPFTINGTITPTGAVAVPEPSTLTLMGLGLAGVVCLRRARRVS